MTLTFCKINVAICCVLLHLKSVRKKDILKEAKLAPDKRGLEAHRDAISVLRQKDYTWREIADFLNERGIETDHTKVFRLFKKQPKKREMNQQEMKIPTSTEYQKALAQIEVSENQRAMLKAHYEAPNRSITYTELADAVGYDGYTAANLHYGKLCIKLSAALEFTNWVDENGTECPNSVVGQMNQYSSGDFQLVMHHELAKALHEIDWFS